MFVSSAFVLNFTCSGLSDVVFLDNLSSLTVSRKSGLMSAWFILANKMSSST